MNSKSRHDVTGGDDAPTPSTEGVPAGAKPSTGRKHSEPRATLEPDSERKETLRGIEMSLARERREHDRGRLHKSEHRGRLAKLLHELRGLLFQYGRVGARSERALSAKTRRERRVTMRRMLIDLHRGELKLCHLYNFRSRHTLAVLSHWTELGLKSSTLATYVSHLRTFVKWIHKPELLVVIERYCSEHPGLTWRRTATEVDKSARGAGVDLGEILRRAQHTGDEHFLSQLLLVMAFGLRARESWLFRPHLADRPGYILITAGTKGGRPRTLPTPLTASQSLVLERAKALVPYGASMIPACYKRVVEWARRYYRLCKQVGLTRAGLGVTTHSLRHGVLLDTFAEIAGGPAPVREGENANVDPHRAQIARELVSELAGHSRTSVTSAYLGSSRVVRRKRRALPSLADPDSSSVPLAADSASQAPGTSAASMESLGMAAETDNEEGEPPSEG